MVVLDDIQVRVLVDHEVAKEYEHPEYPSTSTPGYAHRCIRAEPGQSLAVEVGVLAGFDLRHAPYIVVKMQCDGFGRATRRKCTVERIEHNSHQIVTVGGRIAVFETCKMKDDRTGKWYRCRYVFRDLEETRAGHSVPTLSAMEAEDLGTIRITVFRAFRVAVTPNVRRGERRREVDRVSEEDMHERQLTSTVQRVVDGEIEEPPVKQFRYIPLPGSFGEKSHFKYYYRSKRPLQSMGVMPRTPPPPDPFKGSSPAGFSAISALFRRKEKSILDLNAKLLEQNDDYELPSPVKRAPKGAKRSAPERIEEDSGAAVKVKKEEPVVITLSSDSDSE